MNALKTVLPRHAMNGERSLDTRSSMEIPGPLGGALDKARSAAVDAAQEVLGASFMR